jgi:uncharacterized protein
MLHLDLSRIRTPQQRFERVYDPGEIPADDSFRIGAPVALAFDIFKDGNRFHLVGGVKTTLELPCGRCLEPLTLDVDEPFDLRYQPRAENTGEGERELAGDDMSTAFYDDDTIDLEQLMKEQFHLAVPMKPLCREDCRGLCPECGTNLNRGACACTHRWQDPRLDALRQLGQKHRN